MLRLFSMVFNRCFGLGSARIHFFRRPGSGSRISQRCLHPLKIHKYSIGLTKQPIRNNDMTMCLKNLFYFCSFCSNYFSRRMRGAWGTWDIQFTSTVFSIVNCATASSTHFISSSERSFKPPFHPSHRKNCLRSMNQRLRRDACS